LRDLFKIAKIHHRIQFTNWGLARVTEKIMILSAFTLFHVILSLLGIGSGFVVLYGLFTSNRFDGWTSLFLTTTVATSVTGFLFPVHHFMPSHALGIISLALLAVAIPARYHFRLAAPWGRIYVGTAVTALYFNVFVLVVQLFQKVPSLKALAPTQSETPFQITQLAVLLLFLTLGILAAVRFRKETVGTV
jgi:hypothetical protein